MTRVAILGSTGSIGRQALEVVRRNEERLEVVALCAGSNAGELTEQVREFRPGLAGIVFGTLDVAEGTKVLTGPDVAEQIVNESDCDVVLNALVGAAGLKATLATLQSGRILALANKESLVAAGELVMGKARPGQIRPVDSEHSALWQLLEGLAPESVRRVHLTGSGGPFLGRTAPQLGKVTVSEALNHPVWDMGPKITVDSATLMNKGLEVIEAHFLFGLTYDEIEVVIHPQGLVHAMASTVDGATFMHAAIPDMGLPIRLALCGSDTASALLDSGGFAASGARESVLMGAATPPSPPPLRFEPSEHPQLNFSKPDTDTFRCLPLAYEAGRRGDTYPAALNAANEIAVSAFLDGRLPFLAISQIVETVLDRHTPQPPDLDGVLAADEWAREAAMEVMKSL